MSKHLVCVQCFGTGNKKFEILKSVEFSSIFSHQPFISLSDFRRRKKLFVASVVMKFYADRFRIIIIINF
jgi:hypothetical protein